MEFYVNTDMHVYVFFAGTNLYYSRSQATLGVTKFDNAIRA